MKVHGCIYEKGRIKLTYDFRNFTVGVAFANRKCAMITIPFIALFVKPDNVVKRVKRKK